jgi:hypothetical protein
VLNANKLAMRSLARRVRDIDAEVVLADAQGEDGGDTLVQHV